jgi:predicted dithiol-disulfide oxidoreductase (DUF899 family)/GNAT superfamily N-acetyltransferase
MTTDAGSTEWWSELKSITLHVEGESPRLWPESASEEYRRARMELVAAEAALRDQVEAVAARRRALPAGGVLAEHTLVEGPADLDAGDEERPVTLGELFAGHDELVLYHLMLHPQDTAACAACSMFVDGLDGVERHVAQRAGFAVVAPAPLPVLRAWARRRGWRRVRLVSCAGTGLLEELGVAGSRGALFPAFSVHVREGDGRIRHAVTQPADFPDATARGMDLMSPVWNLFDLLPSGRGERDPDNTYPLVPSRRPISAPPVPPTVEITDDPRRIDVDLVHRELAASYWSPGVPRAVVEAAIAGSQCWSAHRDGQQVGFARLITDRATFGWISDVFVVERARGTGIGRALVAAVVERAQRYGLRRVMLATRDAHEVYRPFGFTDPPAGLLMQRTVDTPREVPGPPAPGGR